jgi:transcriptional regulator with XRE-family HTH domain
VSSTRANPTVRRWELAAALRALRLSAGLSIDDVAAELMCSPAKVSRLETAGRGIQPRDVRDLSRLYKISDEERGRLMALAGEARQQAWWHGLRNLSAETTSYIGLEAAAERIHCFEMARIPGLLQTAAYTRSLLAAVKAPDDPRENSFVEDTVEARRLRQEQSRRPGVQVVFAMDETVLNKPFGTRADRLEQVDFLIASSETPNYSLHIIQHGRGLHPGVDGTFTHMQFPEQTPTDVVTVEGLLGIFLLEKPADIARYQSIFNHVISTFAMNSDESRKWLQGRRSSLSSGAA